MDRETARAIKQVSDKVNEIERKLESCLMLYHGENLDKINETANAIDEFLTDVVPSLVEE